jgi:trigger factor
MASVETLGALERRISMSVPSEDIERQIGERLKKLARNAKMDGFRPGKVPFKLVQAQYGPQVRYEVIGEAVQKTFEQAVRENKLKVAGQPRIEPTGEAGAKAFEFSATFEVYPEFKPGDVSNAQIERPQVSIGDAEVDKTIGILRKQRSTYHAVERASQPGDRVVVSFEGRIDGEVFKGGQATDFAFLLGEGRMLPEFEAAATGMRAGEKKAFTLKFPDDYQAKDVAGKTASFELSVSKLEEPRLPELDGEFARTLGVKDGDLAKMRAEVRANVEREVRKRVTARVKGQALQLLHDATPVELPKALVAMEAQGLAEKARAEFESRGMKMEKLPIDPSTFEASAKRRVALGLIIAELARAEGLQPRPDQVRKLIEEQAESYESPAEVVKWFYMQPQRLSEMEGLALEDNVVNWVLSKAKVVDKPVAFDELMGGGT